MRAKRRVERWAAAACAAAALCGPGSGRAAGAAPAHPNVVILLADDLGFAAVACRGAPIAPPAIDRLAAEGLRLERFYSDPICSPTRAALLSGRDAMALGVAYDQINPWNVTGFPPDAYLISHAFRAAGYQTG